jgi:hypothetical protein
MVNETSDLNQSTNSLRMRSAMILFALEEALGAFVLAQSQPLTTVPQGMLSAIEARSKKKLDSVPSVIGETYIGEILDIAIASAKGSAEEEYLRKLKQLVDNLALFEVRNAVCHPNRPFPENYWYRMATLATDTCVENLRLTRVQDAFRNALENRINPPPEGWFAQRLWAVPNNLPASFEHEITGLIAREDERRDLLRRLKNPRFHLVAVVGRGGSGKTALSLEALRTCAADAGTLNWADQIIYISAKTERLTVAGVEAIKDPADSLSDVQAQIAAELDEEDWQSVLDSHHERRLLVCIDNLETLIRDHPEEFDTFVDSLPPSWRFVVTSRIPVNSANVITLGPIQRSGAVKLAREYLSRRGGERLDESVLERLADMCEHNPLAIRLTIDSYLAGVELNKAISETKENVITYSYSNLIEALSESAIRILECLFSSEHAESRTSIGDLLGISADEVAEGLNPLLKTSLINRQTTENQELYALSSSVRELLLKVPRDSTTRAEVQRRLRDRRQLLAEVKDAAQDSLDENFIPASAPTEIRALGARVFRSLHPHAGRSAALTCLADISRALEFRTDDPTLYRLKALLLRLLGDNVGALEAITRGATAASSDPASVLLLAEWLRDDGRIDEAFEYSSKLVADGWDSLDRAGDYNVIRLLKAHWVSALWLKRHDQVLQATSDWETPPSLAATRGALRVSALRRKCEGESASVKQGIVTSALELIESLLRQQGYVGTIVHEVIRALQDFAWFADHGELNAKLHLQLCSLVVSHLPGMCSAHRSFSLDGDEARNLVTKLQSLDCGSVANPLLDPVWLDRYGFGSKDKALEEAGYIEARITYIPKRPDGLPRDYLFARAIDGTREYHVRRETTQLSQREFAKLQTGQIIRVLPGDNLYEGSAFPTRDVIV